jgi:hypothetical protein
MSKSDGSEKSIHTLISQYAEAAAAHGQGSWDGNYKKANRNYDIVANIRRELMERGEEGRMALLELLNHPDPHVRTSAAAYALQFAPERAEAVLVEVGQSDVGIVSFTAEMTLEQWRKGELKFPERR